MTTGRLPRGGTGIDRDAPARVDVRRPGADRVRGRHDRLRRCWPTGIRVVGRSIYHDRPRGVVSAGPEEPNALVQVTWPSGVSEPMVNAATTAARGRPGRPVADRPGPPRDRRRRRALRCAARPRRRPRHRGRVSRVGRRQPRPARRTRPLASCSSTRDPRGDRRRRPRRHDGARRLRPRPGHRRPASTRCPGTEGRLWRIRAGRIVLATGATERPIVVADGDRPGVMLASAAATYVRRYGVRPGSRAVIFTNNDTTRDVEAALAEAGVEVVGRRGCPSRRAGPRHGRRRRRRAGRRRHVARPVRCRPAAVVRWLEPERRAVEPRPRHAPLRRRHRRLRPGRSRHPPCR